MPNTCHHRDGDGIFKVQGRGAQLVQGNLEGGATIQGLAYLCKETHSKYARKLAKEVGGLGNLVHIVGTHHFIPLAMAMTRKQAAISMYIRHHTLKPYCTTHVCEAVTQDEDGEDQSIEDPDDTPEDDIDVVLMDPHKVIQWVQYEKELEPPIMDHSILYGTQLEQHAKVIQVLDSSQEHGQSPTEVLAERYLAGDQYVVKNIRTLPHICSIALKGAGQQDHISQQQFLQLLYQLAQKKIRQGESLQGRRAQANIM